MSRVFIALKEKKIDFKGYDSEVYVEHFTAEKLVCLDTPIYDTYRIL
jgi:DNA polymerase III sliding clamp (beta) subunit (PCNA family)